MTHNDEIALATYRKHSYILLDTLNRNLRESNRFLNSFPDVEYMKTVAEETTQAINIITKDTTNEHEE